MPRERPFDPDGLARCPVGWRGDLRVVLVFSRGSRAGCAKSRNAGDTPVTTDCMDGTEPVPPSVERKRQSGSDHTGFSFGMTENSMNALPCRSASRCFGNDSGPRGTG